MHTDRTTNTRCYKEKKMEVILKVILVSSWNSKSNSWHEHSIYSNKTTATDIQGGTNVNNIY